MINRSIQNRMQKSINEAWVLLQAGRAEEASAALSVWVDLSDEEEREMLDSASVMKADDNEDADPFRTSRIRVVQA